MANGMGSSCWVLGRDAGRPLPAMGGGRETGAMPEAWDSRWARPGAEQLLAEGDARGSCWVGSPAGGACGASMLLGVALRLLTVTGEDGDCMAS